MKPLVAIILLGRSDKDRQILLDMMPMWNHWRMD